MRRHSTRTTTPPQNRTFNRVAFLNKNSAIWCVTLNYFKTIHIMSRCLKDIIFISPALLKMFVCNFCSFFLLFLNSSSWLVFEVTCLIDIGQVHYFLSDFVLKSTVMSLWLKILHIQCAYMEDIRMKDKQSFRLKKKNAILLL